MSKIRVAVLDVQNECYYDCEVENTLKSWYSLIGCTMIEAPTRIIGSNPRKERHEYTIICDEEGLFNDSPKISAINDYGEVMFVGNLVFCNTDWDEGEFTSLDDCDIEFIGKHIQNMGTRMHPHGYPMLTQCEFE